ncbi:hypothetical protein B0H14DRAFT_3520712 [Mycena olivaceomarginata]|nr:hypothetical protein B0H14DRAFT_3520712 [Mycena olivaceomarginata]
MSTTGYVNDRRSQDPPHCWSVSRDQMKPDEGPYLPTSRACAHLRPYAVPAVVLSPLRAALDRSCPSSPHLRLLHTSACSCSSSLKDPPFPSLDLRCSSFHSLAPFPASTRIRERLWYAVRAPFDSKPHTRPLCPSFKHCVCRAAIGEGGGGGGVWNPLSTPGLLSARRMYSGEKKEGGEYSRQVSGKDQADAEPVDESVVCKAE